MHPTFHRNGLKKQFEVKYQLAITLRYFVNPSRYSKMASDLGVGYGSAPKCFDRVIEAILSLKEEYLSWPGRSERKQIAEDPLNPIPGCIGLIDGTKTKLYFKTEAKAEQFFSNKSDYSVSAQTVINTNGDFVYFVSGFPGAMHDSTTYKACMLDAEHYRFFSQNEFLLGDKAYPLSDHLITPYKNRPSRRNQDGMDSNGLTKQEAYYNKLVIDQRIAIENAFGRLKGRFPIFKEVRYRIRSHPDPEKRIATMKRICSELKNYSEL